MKALATVLLAASGLAYPAYAQEHGGLPAPTPFAPFPSSVRTPEFVIVPPFGPLPVRIYTTPSQGPFYNVPPYRVVAPY